MFAPKASWVESPSIQEKRVEEGRGCIIATTSSRHAAKVLDELTALGVQFALLHGANQLEREPSGMLSDVDIAVATPPAVLLPLLARAFPEHGLHVIVVWNYEIGGATTLLLSTHDAADGVQLDLLCDDHGVGTDGLMTPWILQQRELSGRWPSSNPMHELLYLIRKRDRKGNATAVRVLVEHALGDHPRDHLRVEAFKLFRGPVARRVCALLDGQSAHSSDRRAAAPTARMARYGQRLKHPVGFWAEYRTSVGADADVRMVAETFGRFMPYSNAGPRPSGTLASLPWYSRDVAPVRWRPGLFTSWAPTETQRTILRPDLVIGHGASQQEIRCRIVAAMEARVMKRAAAVVDIGRLESALGGRAGSEPKVIPGRSDGP